MNISLRKIDEQNEYLASHVFAWQWFRYDDDCGNFWLAKFDASKTSMLQVTVLHITRLDFSLTINF